MKIATLVPAATDIVAALGFGSSIVGISHECDHPLATGRPILTSSSIPAAGVSGDASAADVDAAVADAMAGATPLYDVDTDLLVELDADVVISQTICDVCAVRRDHFSDRLPATMEFCDLTATTIDGLFADIRSVASALDVPERGEGLVAQVEARLGAVRQSVAGKRRPTVVTLEWSDPPFIGGHWVPEVVELAGGTHALASAGTPSHRVGWDDIVAAEPDVVLSLPCGYDLDGSVTEAERVLAGPMAGRARGAQVWALDANRVLSRLTPAIATAAEAVAGILHGGPVDPAVARAVTHPDTASRPGAPA